METDERAESSASTWLELSVEADSESVEAVSELMSRYVYGGVAVYEQYRQDPNGDNLTTDPTKPVMVVGYVSADDQSVGIVRKLEEGLWHLRHIGPVGPLMQREQPEEDWANAWKEHFQVLRIGRRFVIRPTWREYVPEPDDLIIDLDPGMAFGTGHHPTTELCLRWLEDLDVDGKRVLDVGAGSGILTIAASLLGASEIDCIEVDDIAARALRENLELNAVSAKTRVIVGDFLENETTDGQYDLVLANIISSILLRLANPLSRAVRPGGQLVLSGVIERHVEHVRNRFSEHGMRVVDERKIGDWFAMLLEHDA